MVRRRRAVPRSGAPVHRARPLRPPHALQPGRAPEDVGVPRVDGGPVETDPRKIWRRFAENFPLFRGTPSWLWLNHAFTEVFGFDERLSADNADRALRPHRRLPGDGPSSGRAPCSSASTSRCWRRPRARSTTCRHHRKIKDSGWRGRVLTAFRPDPVVDPAFPGFLDNLAALGRDHRRRRLDLAGLSRRARRAARLFQVGRLHLDRPRPPDRAHRRSLAGRSRGAVTTACARAARRPPTPSCSAPRC